MLSESHLHKIIMETVNDYIENDSNNDSEFKELIEYFSQEPTENFRDERGRIDNLSLKAYNYIDPIGVVNNVYALHFTDLEAYEDILVNGFKGGTCDFDRLAYSDARFNGDENCTDGYFFALPVDGKYIGEDIGYGDCAYILKLNAALLIFHNGDGDKELIFKNRNVVDKVGFMYDEDYHCWVPTAYKFDIDKNELEKYNGYIHEESGSISFDDLHDLIRFALDNF